MAGRFEEARAVSERAVKLAEELDDKRTLANVRANLVASTRLPVE